MSTAVPVVALAGNPNVGKSTVFNRLTGMHQHTGNWPGKTVELAQGLCSRDGMTRKIVDLPGAYSLVPRSGEETVTRDFICFQRPDAVVAVCDAACLERNLSFVLQIMEVTPRVVVCVNLLDEAEKRGICPDLALLQQRLGVPVVGTAARSGKGVDALLSAVAEVEAWEAANVPAAVRYTAPIEQALKIVEPTVRLLQRHGIGSRWIALRLLEQDAEVMALLNTCCGAEIAAQPAVAAALQQAWDVLQAQGIDRQKLQDNVTACTVLQAEALCLDCVSRTAGDSIRDRELDRIFSGRITGWLVMAALLGGLLWLTAAGANLPSAWLSSLFTRGEAQLLELAQRWGTPPWLYQPLIFGVYRVLTWVVAVMLPPMAIFFPLFTLLEDSGYLPRVAFNLDRCLKGCGACGKQALTMAMGLGCNAVGVTGCRIIDSPRERRIALLTNSFIPCNGRLPPLTAGQQKSPEQMLRG